MKRIKKYFALLFSKPGTFLSPPSLTFTNPFNLSLIITLLERTFLIFFSKKRSSLCTPEHPLGYLYNTHHTGCSFVALDSVNWYPGSPRREGIIFVLGTTGFLVPVTSTSIQNIFVECLNECLDSK